MKYILHFLTISLLAFSAFASNPHKADLIITNAKVYTLSWDAPASDGTPASTAPFNNSHWTPDATTVVIGKGKILAVGHTDLVNQWKNDTTQIIDVNQATLLPGFVDSHVHVAELGEILTRINLTSVTTPEEAIAKTLKESKHKKPGEWIIGQGWDEGAWSNHYPNRQLLDKAFPNNPVVLKSLHGFAVWVNTKALQELSIDHTTQSPSGGEILKDTQGLPTGIFLNRATPLVLDNIPQPSQQEFTNWIKAGLQQMANDGYVAVHQAGATARHIQAFQQLHSNKTLPIRLYAMLSAREPELGEQWIKRGPMSSDDGFLDIRSVKAYYDGSLGSRGAKLLEPYADMPNHKGVSGSGYGFDFELVTRLMKAGFQVGIHAIGDAGNRETIDFFTKVFNEHPKAKNNRHRIEHAQVIHANDFKRMAELNLIASMEPPHAVEDKAWAEERLGKERIKGAYAWRTLREHNIPLTFNSDLPGSDHSIFYGLHAAVNRTSKNGEPKGGWYPEQAVTIEEAVRAYTINSAYAAFREQEAGTIEVGKWGDLTLLKNDVFNQPATELLNNEVLMTIVAGEVVFGKSN